MSVAVYRPGCTCTVNDTDRPLPLRATPRPDRARTLLPAPLPLAVSVVATGQVRLNEADAEVATVLGADRTTDREDVTGAGAGCCWAGWLDRAGADHTGELLTRTDGGETVTRCVTRTVGAGVLAAELLLGVAVAPAVTEARASAAGRPPG